MLTAPIETLFVLDSMMGQEAANTAKAFDEVVPLTGVILTKLDGDARGGAALSVSHVLGKPIKFIGAGEKISALEPFYPRQNRLTHSRYGRRTLISRRSNNGMLDQKSVQTHCRSKASEREEI